MALTHLLDSSVLTRLREPAIRAAIEPDAERGGLARAGISDLEIGYSARSDVEWDRLLDALEVFELVETTADHLVRADRFSVSLPPSTSAGARSLIC